MNRLKSDTDAVVTLNRNRPIARTMEQLINVVNQVKIDSNVDLNWLSFNEE